MAKVQLRAAQTLFHGWGFVEGKWVYVPLWDPAPIDKKFKGFKQLQLASAVNDLAAQISSPNVSGKLKEITKDLIARSGKSSLVAWEEGDGICPDWWPWPKFPGGGGNPDPDPVYFPTDLSKSLVNQLAGHLLNTLGAQVKMPQLQEIGKELMG